MKKVLGAAVLLLGAATAHAEITPNDPLPTHILTCGGSVITNIWPRLEALSIVTQKVPIIRSFNENGEQVSPADLQQLATEENESDDA